MDVDRLKRHGLYSLSLVANELRTAKSELTRTLGLEPEDLSDTDQYSNPSVQHLLNHLVGILQRVERRTGSSSVAYNWYRTEPLVGFGNATADQLVRENKATLVHAYLDHIETGGFA